MTPVDPPKILGTHRVAGQKLADAVSDYVREMFYPAAEEIDCVIGFTKVHGVLGANVRVLSIRAAIPERQTETPRGGQVCPHVFCSDCARESLKGYDFENSSNERR